MEGRAGCEAGAVVSWGLYEIILLFVYGSDGLTTGSFFHPCPGGFGQEWAGGTRMGKGRVLPRLSQVGILHAADVVFSGMNSPFSLLWNNLSACS